MGFVGFFLVWGTIGLAVFVTQFCFALDMPIHVCLLVNLAVSRAFLAFVQAIFERDDDDKKGPPLPPAMGV